MGWLFHLAEPFIWEPGRALLVGLSLAILGLIFRLRGGRPLLIAAGAWGIFALLELIAWRQRYDIRVDLLVTWPTLLLVTIGCLVTWVRRLVRR
jgi:hypothetical protein